MNAQKGGRFVTTRWTLVAAAAAGTSDPQRREALEDLCQTYWPPLYAFLRRRGHTAEDAQDLTQGFFARVLERHDFRAADPARGRFRSFLLTALQHYVINEHERATTAKRGGQLQRLSLDFEEVERTYVLEGRDDDSPDHVFNRKWAAITLDRALQRLRDECREAGKGALAEALLPYLTDAGHLPPYRSVAEQLGLTEGATKVAVHRLRQRFGAILRLEIAETVLAPADVDDEVRELIRALSPS
jgi:RNA polymerase sigma factor (sigma-70 family)